MEVLDKKNLPAPPGIINSIKSGFELVANNLVVIAFPLLLNLFYWLGPRLRMDQLFNMIKTDMLAIWQAGGASTVDIQRAIDIYDFIIPNLNLFWMFRTYPIGVSSLILPQEVSRTPLGYHAVLQVTPAGLFGWIFLLNILGWIAGGLYYYGVSRLTIPNPEPTVLRFLRAMLQTILLSLAWAFLVTLLGFPALVLLGLVLQLNSILANLLLLLVSLFSMWVIVPLFFWPHGVFLKNQNFLVALRTSFHMARLTLPTSSLFVLTLFLLSFGLNFLWSVPPGDSWMMLVGIFGHSFVATAILASSFVYYRDTTTWLQAVVERLKVGQSRQA